MATDLSKRDKAKLVLKAMRRPPQQWGPFESSSSSRVYYVVRNSEDRLSCNCPRWTFKRFGARDCPHVDRVVQGNGLHTERREDGCLYVTD